MYELSLLISATFQELCGSSTYYDIGRLLMYSEYMSSISMYFEFTRVYRGVIPRTPGILSHPSSFGYIGRPLFYGYALDITTTDLSSHVTSGI